MTRADELGFNEKEDHIETKEIPKVINWRKMRLWVRGREQVSGFVYEARLLNTGSQVQRQLGKAYVKDNAISKKEFTRLIKEGFKCCFCEKSFKLNMENLETVEIPKEDAPEFIEELNILCGKCWGKNKSRRGKKLIKNLED